MKAICLGLVWVLAVCLPIGAAIHTIDVSGLAGCEDTMDSNCTNHAPVAYIGYFDWFEMGMWFSYEGTKVCFDITPLHGCTVSEIYFTYDGIGNPGGYTWAQDNGPVIIKSYDPGTCQPVCGTYFNPCSNCPDGSVYVTDTVAGGTGNVIPIADDVMDPAVMDLQAAIDAMESCFCLCMTWDGIISYEVAMSGLHLDIEAD
ncbi:MAG TPA: hypothetical protein PLV45_19555, partial [bacterium]|nr:hypothetical protein [bacterium]